VSVLRLVLGVDAVRDETRRRAADRGYAPDAGAANVRNPFYGYGVGGGSLFTGARSSRPSYYGSSRRHYHRYDDDDDDLAEDSYGLALRDEDGCPVDGFGNLVSEDFYGGYNSD
jgi:hypothetical protein